MGTKLDIMDSSSAGQRPCGISQGWGLRGQVEGVLDMICLLFGL
jgi:hypothetical protein